MPSPSKTEVAAAAVRVLQERNEDVTREAVQAVVAKRYGNEFTISQQVFESALKGLEQIGAESQARAAKPPAAEMDRFLKMMGMARDLLREADGDKDAVVRLVQAL